VGCFDLKANSANWVGLAQMVRFLIVESTHLGLNLRFDMSVAYL
jgi:hypothetical protein